MPYIVYTYRAQETEASTAGAFSSTKWNGREWGTAASSVQELFGSQNAGTSDSAGVLREGEG